MKTVLVAGGAGFLGSHFCELLLKKEYRVICVDNLITGNENNIAHLKTNQHFVWKKHDITKQFQIQEPVHFILNLASPASPIDYQKIPIETLDVGAIGTKNLLEFAKEKNAVFLLASTSEVYGDPAVNPQPETYWGNVNSIGPRSCFSEDTELLTAEGWKYFKDITKTDQILTLNKDKEIEYSFPLEIIKEKYNGQLIEFKNYHCNLLVTPNHKMYVKPRDKSSFILLEAFQAINWDRAQMLKVSGYNEKKQDWFYFPKDIDTRNCKTSIIEKIEMDLWLEFFGYYITEGCVSPQKRKKIINGKEYITTNYRVLIAQSKEKNKENWLKIRKCLEKMPFNFVDSYDHQFCITNKQLALYLIRFGKSHEKYVPQELLHVSKDQLEILFNAMMLGDGNKKGTTYYSTSHRLVSNFQEILLKIGYAGNIAVHDRRKKRHLYQIHILNRYNKKYKYPTYSKRTIVQYDGFVYCVSVPNHIIFVRRNGKALFCGNCYDESKRFAEAITMAYHRIHKVQIRIVRIFNTYGPLMRKNDGRVVPAFLSQALSNQAITVFGDGLQTRSFCYVDDLIQGIYLLMLSEITEPVNIGNPHEFTMIELAKKVIALTGSKSAIVFEPLPQDDPKQRRPDITKAKTQLHWEPKIELEEGLKKTIEWFQQT